MDRSALLADFEAAVAEFERHRGFVEKARRHASKFPGEVVNRVVSDHIERSMAAVERVIPLTGLLEKAVAGLAGERTVAAARKEPLVQSHEELELRMAIGELPEDEAAPLLQASEDALADADRTLAAVDDEVARLQGALDRWNALGHDAGMLAPEGSILVGEADEEPIVDDDGPMREEPDVLEELDLLLPDG